MDLGDIFPAVVSALLMAGFGAIGFYRKKNIASIETLERRVTDVEKNILVLNSQMNDIKKDIDEIKEGVNRLVDRLCQR